MTDPLSRRSFFARSARAVAGVAVAPLVGKAVAATPVAVAQLKPLVGGTKFCPLPLAYLNPGEPITASYINGLHRAIQDIAATGSPTLTIENLKLQRELG